MNTKGLSINHQGRAGRRPITLVLLITFAAALQAPLSCNALDPEPRRWSHLPIDENYLTLALVKTNADIYFNPTLLLEDVEQHLDTQAAQYVRTFEWMNKSYRFELLQAHQSAKWAGLLDGIAATTAREGASDTFVRVAMNLYGAPPLRGEAFREYRASETTETIVGVALNARLPTGHYQKDRLLNLGQNRFVLRPQLGVVHSRRQWSVELTGEIALHGENDEFVRSNTLKQRPLYILHSHLIYAFSAGQWVSISLGFDYGGENQLNGIAQDDKQQNVGWKLSYAHPLTPTLGLKASYLGSQTRRQTGLDSETFALSVSFTW
ncbi:hypothetical protein AUP74_03300 [Microbulbifer aggregans]|uniref:MetA-pathway of phenol degradation n=1 Tax=Microbulbifer aggregans TaxID=1769779 RepID=A0A1C9WBY3_9GAMM|nr:transporter [Microbulbifer aggregans]AOS98666.1 hypothetical protein AUP74_03300 [Microbulbifer aggregans]